MKILDSYLTYLPLHQILNQLYHSCTQILSSWDFPNFFDLMFRLFEIIILLKFAAAFYTTIPDAIIFNFINIFDYTF